MIIILILVIIYYIGLFLLGKDEPYDYWDDHIF